MKRRKNDYVKVRPQSKEVLENEENQGNRNSRLESIDTTDSSITEVGSTDQEPITTTAVIVHRHQETAL